MYMKDKFNNMTEQDALWNCMVETFPNTIPEQLYKTDLKKDLENIEQDSIKNALEVNNGNRTKAADMLSLGRTCLIAKMKKYELV